MSDDEDRAPLTDLRHVLLNDGLGLIVQRARRFIEDQDARIRDQRPGNRDPLALPTRERAAVLSHQRVIAFRQFQNEFVRAGQRGRLHHRLHPQPRIGQRDVVAHGQVEEKILLQHDADLPAQPRRIHLREVHSVHQNTAPLRHIEPLKQLRNRTLAGPGPPDKPNHSARRHGERHLPEHLRTVRAIAKGHVLEHDVSMDLGQRGPIRIVGRLRLRIQDIPQPLHRDAHLLQLLPQIHETQQRARHLGRQHIEGNQLPDGEIPLDDPIGPHPQYGHDRDLLNASRRLTGDRHHIRRAKAGPHVARQLLFPLP